MGGLWEGSTDRSWLHGAIYLPTQRRAARRHFTTEGQTVNSLTCYLSLTIDRDPIKAAGAVAARNPDAGAGAANGRDVDLGCGNSVPTVRSLRSRRDETSQEAGRR